MTLRSGDLRAPVHLDVLDQPVVLLRQELGEGVRRLVHVVVRVKDGKVDNSLWHGHLRSSDHGRRRRFPGPVFNIDVNIIPLLRPGDHPAARSPLLGQTTPGRNAEGRRWRPWRPTCWSTAAATAAGATSGWPASCARRGTRSTPRPSPGSANGPTCWTSGSTSTGTSTDVAAVLRFEDLRDVILVGHSYGGMVITGAADRVPDRVGRLVYLDAATPRQRPVAGRRGRTGDQRRAADGRGRRRHGAGAAARPRRRPALRGHRPGGPGLDGGAPDAPPVGVLRAAARLSATRTHCGPSRSSTSCARRPCPPGTAT